MSRSKVMLVSYTLTQECFSPEASILVGKYTEKKKKRIFTLVVICIKDVFIVKMNLC